MLSSDAGFNSLLSDGSFRLLRLTYTAMVLVSDQRAYLVLMLSNNGAGALRKRAGRRLKLQGYSGTQSEDRLSKRLNEI